MAVNKLELPTVPPKASWAVTGIFPVGHTSMLYAPAGVGKTRIVSYLAAQMTRPYPNGLFLGHEVRGGRVVILDADDPMGYGYAVWLNRFLAAHSDTRRELIDLRAITGGLTPEDVAKLQAELKDTPPRLIVIDTFASAFVGLDILRAHHVQLALVGLAQLAKDLGCAVLILDHVGKLQPGQTVASKGPYGAAKTFSPRAVFALSRMPPKEVEGRDILKLECTKMSYAPELPPKGVEISLEENDTVARARLADLPGKTMLENAVSALKDELKRADGEPLTRKLLLQAAVEKVNITERWAAKALDELLDELGDRVEVLTLPAKGSPKAYRYVLSSSNDDSSVRDGETFDEQLNSLNGESSANGRWEMGDGTMTSANLLNRLEAEGVSVSLSLKVEANAKPSDEVANLIKEERDNLITLLVLRHISGADYYLKIVTAGKAYVMAKSQHIREAVVLYPWGVISDSENRLITTWGDVPAYELQGLRDLKTDKLLAPQTVAA